MALADAVCFCLKRDCVRREAETLARRRRAVAVGVNMLAVGVSCSCS